jgi:organic hydroperoxide reductase OsmC/OhrA
MVVEVDVSLTNVPGTEAAMGWAGSHVLMADRPPGKAGGMGLGFSGAELLALSLGGCFCNDLRYVAERRGVAIDRIAVQVSLKLAGQPLLAVSARLRVRCDMSDGSPAGPLIEDARAICMVANSLQRGVAVDIAEARD